MKIGTATTIPQWKNKFGVAWKEVAKGVNAGKIMTITCHTAIEAQVVRNIGRSSLHRYLQGKKFTARCVKNMVYYGLKERKGTT